MDSYSLDQMNAIPAGFKNTIFWNIAHVVVTQQLLMYNLCGLPMRTDADLVAKYRKGTRPETPASEKELEQIQELLFTTLEKTRDDIDTGAFRTVDSYRTSTGFVINSIEDAATFNTFHEGVHLGYVLALKKAL